MAKGTFERAEALRRLRSTAFDVVVVGGGVMGCGIAVDAASRGLRTALLERDDFASGTSSRSSMLLHGDLRLANGHHYDLVSEALVERARLRNNAPHLVADLPFLVPLSELDGRADRRGIRRLGSALWIHDLAAGWRPNRRHRRIDPLDLLALAPTLDPVSLTGGYLFHDAWADDARLTLALARTAALDLGAVVANRAEVVAMRRDVRGNLVGVRVKPVGQPSLDVSARWVVNAAGVWAAEVAELPLSGATATLPRVRPSKGVHVTVPRAVLPVDAAVVIPATGPERDVVVVPWSTHTYIGTTFTPHRSFHERPRCTADDVRYLLEAVNAAFTGQVSPRDISGSWAGLRPVLAEPSGGAAEEAGRRRVELSESHVLSVGDGVISVVGGRLTTYRRIAAEAVDAVMERLDERTRLRVRRHSTTRQLRLRGWLGWTDVRDGRDLGRPWPETLRHHLAGRHGSDARTVLAMIERRSDLARPLIAGLRYVRAEALYAARYEMAGSLADVLERRTRGRLLEREATAAAAEDTAELIGDELGWDARRRAAEVSALLEDFADEGDALSSHSTDSLRHDRRS